MSQLKMLDFTKQFRPNKKIVYCHGCWDCCHIGHIRHLQAAKAMGDILIVTVTSDRFASKGKGRPIFSEAERAEALCALQCVDYVAINDAPDPIKMINTIKPNIYVKGSDYKGKNYADFDAVRYIGGRMAFTKTPKFSTTELIEKLKKC